MPGLLSFVAVKESSECDAFCFHLTIKLFVQDLYDMLVPQAESMIYNHAFKL